MRRQFPFQDIDDELLIGFGFCITREDQFAAVGGGEVDVEHLDGGEFFQSLAGCQARRMGREERFEGHMQAVGREGHEDVAFDPVHVLVENGTDFQIAFQCPERRLDLNEFEIELPQISRISFGEVGAQEVAAFAAAPFAQGVPVDMIQEGDECFGAAVLGK